MRRLFTWWLHNLVAHPLLVLCPPLGEWLHDRTIPKEPRPYAAEPRRLRGLNYSDLHREVRKLRPPKIDAPPPPVFHTGGVVKSREEEG